ncbi:hypothetical protein D4764_04G0013920 [Takifugu flavidus]|uniref:Alkylated DNA repair protein AlkB homologue 8 N-terminal domain-containing protein n=1 Tax=Takifugu flavidus TaxID=433684 RepID=A0A5C6N6M5_9TELE|nr:hypothetical protein D4764_04G0013920 [Takifugu flavidus]
MCHIQKFADDTAIVGRIRDDEEEEYRCLVRDFVAWCHYNGLQLNTSKTKELVIDFGRDRPRPRPVQIGTEEVEGVQTYKYLGLWLDSRLDWTSNTRQLYKKTQSRMYFLRRLRSFNICRKLLWMFYQSVVASVLSYAVVCWGGECDKSGPLQAGEADQAGQLGGGDEAETSGDSGREENYRQAAEHHGQCPPPSAHCPPHPEKPDQPEAAPPQVQDQQTGELIHPPSHQTVQLLTGGEEGQQKDWNNTAIT